MISEQIAEQTTQLSENAQEALHVFASIDQETGVDKPFLEAMDVDQDTVNELMNA